MSLKEVELSIVQSINLVNGLAALDGYMRIVGDKTVKAPYTLDGKKVRLRASKNINRLTPIIKAFETARDALHAEYMNGGEEMSAHQTREYQSKVDEMAQAVEKIEIHMINVDDLKLETNAIPTTVLAALGPILLEDEEPVV